MAKPRLNKPQKTWLKTFLLKHPYYKKQRIWEGLSGDAGYGERIATPKIYSLTKTTTTNHFIINRPSVFAPWTPMPWYQAKAEYEEEYTNC